MSFSVVKPVLKVARTYQWLQRLAFWQGIGVAVLLAATFHPALWSTAVLLPDGLLLLYGLRKGYMFFRMRRSVQQVHLEQQFLRQHLNPMHLRQCLYRHDHFWRKSLILQALRAILSHPMPSQLAETEKQRRVTKQYRRTLQPLRPSRFNADWIGFAAALATVFAFTSPPLHYVFGGAAIVVALLEGGQSMLQWRLHREDKTMVRRLAEWTLAQDFRTSLRTIERSNYTHHPLYQARPWFITDGGGEAEKKAQD